MYNNTPKNNTSVFSTGERLLLFHFQFFVSADRGVAALRLLQQQKVRYRSKVTTNKCVGVANNIIMMALHEELGGSISMKQQGQASLGSGGEGSGCILFCGGFSTGERGWCCRVVVLVLVVSF